MIDRWPTDEEFAVDLRARDGDAWALAYVRYLAPMRSVARRFGPLGQADDVVHEVFAQFWARPDQFDPERGSLRGYLLTMTRRRSIDVYREDVARRRRETRDLDDGRLSPAASVEADALAGITTDELIMVIRMLPRGEREAIGLAFFATSPTRRSPSRWVCLRAPSRVGFGRACCGCGLPSASWAWSTTRSPGEIAPSGTDPIADP